MPRPKTASNVTQSRIEFGLWLRSERIKRGWSQSKVQNKLATAGYTRKKNWLSERELGRVVLSADDATALGTVYGYQGEALAEMRRRARSAALGPDAVAEVTPPNIGDESDAERDLRTALRRLSDRLAHGPDLLAKLAASIVKQWEWDDGPVMQFMGEPRLDHVEAPQRLLNLLLSLRAISGASPTVRSAFVAAIGPLAAAYLPADLSHGADRAMANARRTEADVMGMFKSGEPPKGGSPPPLPKSTT